MLGSTGVTSVVNMASDKFLAVLGTSYSVSSPAILLGSSGVTTDILLASDYQVSLESGSAVSIMVCELLFLLLFPLCIHIFSRPMQR